eukprot:TRINITY_DN7758_c1_g2_i1.p1 TRINITY_DN7758_c1_g2~~TRINITY_DN7758_c1_g2_i1.p1  ORF type:complete len:1195 (-),score=118.13 TRINITY_DN7758_c1_g2_i1:303-3887(-)
MGSKLFERALDAYCNAIAKRPCAVCWLILVIVLVFSALPFAVFGTGAIVIDFSLGAFRLRGEETATRNNALEAAWCRGICEDDDDDRRLRSEHGGDTYVVYVSKDNTSMLTESRLTQALDLEKRAQKLLGPVLESPLTSIFPNYPDGGGLAQGEALVEKLTSISEYIHDTRNANRDSWPQYDRVFSACDLTSVLLASKFPSVAVDAQYAVFSELGTLETEDAYVTFFPERANTWFGQERNTQIIRDCLKLIGVLLSCTILLAFLTRSIFVAIMGMLSIFLASGVAVCLYRMFVTSWFGILNAFSFFLVLGIGCDDIFVLSDAWRQATEIRQIAADDYPARLRYTVTRAGKAVMNTSLTTAVAFFGNAISLIPPLRVFGLFAGFMVLVDFILTVSFLPAIFVIQHKYFASYKIGPCFRSSTPGSVSKFDLFLVRGTARMLRWAKLIVPAAAIVAGVGLNIALELPSGAEFHESELFPSYHNQARVYAVQQAMRNMKPEFVPVMIVHGVVPKDTGDMNNPDSKSDITWDSSFDPYSLEVQRFVSDMCNSLLGNRGLIRSVDSCWAQGVAANLLQKGLTAATATREEMTEALRATHGLHEHEGGWFATLMVTGTVEDASSVEELRQHYNQWEQLMLQWNARAAEKGIAASSGFQTSYKWQHMATIENLAYSCIAACCVSTAFVAVMLLLMLRNIWMVMLVLVHVVSVCFIFVATLVLAGRRLSVLESIAASLLVGLSVDYLAHVAGAYLEDLPDAPRGFRAVAAVGHLGTAVVGGAATTTLSAIFLLFGEVTFFSDFGIFIITLVLLALLATMTSFVACLYLFGPEGRCSNIPCPSSCLSEITKYDDVLMEHVDVPVVSKRARYLTGISVLAILTIAGGIRIALSFRNVQDPTPTCPELQELEFTFESFAVPGDSSDSYRCRGYDAVPPACNYYVQEMEPIIDPKLRGVVHHMVLFAVDAEEQTCPFTCYDMPDARGIDVAWAIGVNKVRWPDDVAYTLGGYRQALQMHYWNPDLRNDLHDSKSGLRLKLSTSPPKHKLTNINVGLHPLGYLRIPPGSSNATRYVECALDLEDEVTVIAFTTHAHKTGIAVKTEVRRSPNSLNSGIFADAVNVGDVGSTPFYDFNFQSIEQFPTGQERKVKPGDVVRVICSFDTRGRMWETRGGWGSEDEMCMTFLYVYPSSNVKNRNCLASAASEI